MPRLKDYNYMIVNRDVRFYSTESLSEVGAWNMLHTNYPELKTLSFKQLKRQGYQVKKFAPAPF